MLREYPFALTTFRIFLFAFAFALAFAFTWLRMAFLFAFALALFVFRVCFRTAFVGFVFASASGFCLFAF